MNTQQKKINKKQINIYKIQMHVPVKPDVRSYNALFFN